jgi:hypothetical protein
MFFVPPGRAAIEANMSSNQFSDKPLPPTEKRCPQCGQMTTSNAGMCWLCLEKFSVQEGINKTAPPTEIKESSDSIAWALLGVIAIVLTVIIALEMPGVLAVILVLAIPALIRTLMATENEPEVKRTSIGAALLLFFSSLGIATFTGAAAAAAFFAICFSVGWVGFVATESFAAVACGIVAGIAAGVLVAVLLFKRLWK